MNAPLLLALDCGTQSVRALLFDTAGKLLAKAQTALDGYHSPQPDWHEHDGEALWLATAETCRKLWDLPGAARELVAGVAVTTQRGTLMPVAADGRVLHPAITWLDRRRAAHPPRPAWPWRAAFATLGLGATVRDFAARAQVNWIAEQHPDIARATAHWLLVSGLLHLRLTGRVVDSAANQVAYLPFDFKRQRWAGALDWKWGALRCTRAQLPQLFEVGTQLGQITPEAAAATGIPGGLPVFAAAADKACEIVGSGAVAPHQGALSYGTTATFSITTPRYLEATPFVPPYPALLPGQYNCEVQIFRGYWLVRWFKEQFGHPERALAEGLGVATESLFDELITQVPPGCDGLLLQPYWSPGVRHPGPEARGAIIGFSDVHTRAHLYRAILEGLGHALRDGCERIERRGGCAVTELRVSGGGAQSDAAMQLTADLFDLPTQRAHTHETSGLGAAMAVSVGLGAHRDFAAAVAAMSHCGRRFTPNPEHARVYAALHRDVYRRMYAQLAPLYRRLARIAAR